MARHIFTKGLQIEGDNISAASQTATHFTIKSEFLKGSDIASASTITIPGPQNYFHVTGTTSLNFISTTGLLDGEEFELYFNSSLVINHNTASPPAGTVPFKLTGAS